MKKLRAILLSLVFIVPLVLSGCFNSSRFKMATPTELTISSGVVRFARVEDDEYYVLDIDGRTINIFPNERTADENYNYVTLYTSNGVDYLEYDATRLFTAGESYVIRLKACGEDKSDSDYTPAYSYTYIPAISAPSQVSISGTTLTWSAVEDAGLYVVKVVTPSDNVLADDPLSIAQNREIDSFQFTSNSFNFSSILTGAGEYKFYVSSVSADSSQTASEFSPKCVYNHSIQLNTPKLGSVQLNESGELHALAVLDANTVSLSISVNGYEKVILLDSQNLVSLNSTGNIYDLNLSEIFNDLSFDYLTRYSFMLKSLGNSYYLDSYTSLSSIYDAITTLEAPVLVVQGYELSWTNLEAISGGVRLYVFTTDGYTSYDIGKELTQFTLPANYIGVFARALGTGNYLDSGISNIISPNTQQFNDFTISASGSSLSWTSLEDGAYYIVEVGNEFAVQTGNSFNLRGISYPVDSIRVSVISSDYAPISREENFSYTLRLATPSIYFDSGNSYLLHINPVQNALAYRVYLIDADGNQSAIENVFTSTEIDLSPYVIREGEYREYSVRAQAVADTLSIYLDSNLSSSVNIVHTPTLDMPEFVSENGVSPVTQDVTNGRYYLNFYGVVGAGSYEISINGQYLVPVIDVGVDMYSINISAYVQGANEYEIVIRALPDENSNLLESEKNTYTFRRTIQLSEVTGITVTESEGRYILSFDLQDLDTQDQEYCYYQVRIVKLNDSSYVDYLESLGLFNIFNVRGSCEITNYVELAGEYRIYVTAMAVEGSLYVSSVESSTYAVIDKLETLDTPIFETFNDRESGASITWTGDNNADYFVVHLTDPNGNEYELRTEDKLSRTIDITRYMTVEGSYSVSIKAMASSDNPMYISSPFSVNESFDYIYNYPYDFDRRTVFMNGEDYSLAISNVEQLTNVLWYHYLFGISETYRLDLYLVLDEEESVRDAIIRLAEQTQDLNMHNFSLDSEWANLLNESTDANLFGYLCRVLIGQYPELAILDNFTISQSSIVGGIKFELYYENALDVEKVDTQEEFISISNDYANDYEYLDSYVRRSGNVIFGIDSRPEMEVSTTEQLVMAVQYGKKPKFVGDSATVEQVYSNAKAVLLSIVSASMTDLEKVNAIYEWLMYAYNLNIEATYTYDETNTIEVEGDIKDYGTRKEFYLEGIFLDLLNETRGGYDGEFYLGSKNATEESFSKAFVLLCSIEGIETRKVNGELSYQYTVENESSTKSISKTHVWNKVYVNTSNLGTDKEWYNVDLTYSDFHPVYNIYSGSLNASYNMASHLFFLVSDEYLSSNMRFSYSNDTMTGSINATLVENENPVAYDYIPQITNSYNYYANTTFGMTRDELFDTLYDYNVDTRDGDNIISAQDFSYALAYSNTNSYQKYNMITGYGELQAYVFNALTYAKHKMINNANTRSSFEIRLNNIDAGGTGSLAVNQITVIVNDMNTYFKQRSFPDNVEEQNVAVKSYQVYDSSTNSIIIMFTMEFSSATRSNEVN